MDDIAIINNILYKKTDLENKDMSPEKVKLFVIPQTFVLDVLNFIHDDSRSSRPAKEISYKQAKLKYFWICMRKEIFTH